MVAKVWQTATHRARLGQAARVDASLVVDECQNFLHLPRCFDEMLAEARGYRLSMVLAHQHLGQLPKELRETVSANARTKVWFTMSPEDARALERHVAPNLTEHDLSHLGAYTAAARLVVDGEETPAFTLATRPAPPAIPGRRRRGAGRQPGRPLPARQPHRSALPAGRAEPARCLPAGPGVSEWMQSPAMSAMGSVQASTEGSVMGIRPGLEPSGAAEPPRQGDAEGSVASADSRGRWS